MSAENKSRDGSHSKIKRAHGNVIKASKKRKRASHEEDAESPAPKKKDRSKIQSQRNDTLISPSKVSEAPGASPFHQQTCSLYLPLPPIAQNHPLQGLCAEHLSPLILTYYAPLGGVLLSFRNAKLSTTPQLIAATDHEPALAHTINEYAAPHVWLTAEFLLFKPRRGDMIEGWINLQNEGNIGLVCWNFFTASIERKKLPNDWKWVPVGVDVRRSKKKKLKGSEHGNAPDLDRTEATPQVKGLMNTQGHFVDGDGRRVEGLIRFTVEDVETSRASGGDTGFLSMEGTLLEKSDERGLREAGARDEDSRVRKHRRKEQSGSYIMSGALVDSEAKRDEAAMEKPRHGSAY
ncbi:MAG: hypothetical protein LQ346_000159 [Caloplaca aetnensis]|nr:MAG: hypothetical protein LQ346_000159 [Caloplaca aetnensis]